MHVLLWVIQILLGLTFAALGVLKLSQLREKLVTSMRWVEDYPADRIKLIGLLEVLAAAGLILPGCTGVLTWLVPLAATGLVVLMVLAALAHRRRGEPRMIAVNAVLGLLAAFVMIFRFGPFSW